MKNSNFTSGSRIMNYLRNYVFLLMAIVTPVIDAEEQEQEVELSVELLEFLGEWETGTGEWIDPVELEDDYYAVLNQDSNELPDE